MLSQINKLHQLAHKPSRLILGLMSGTSLDGLDIALCKVSGADFDTQVELLAFTTAEYPTQFKEQTREVFAKSHVKSTDLCLLNVTTASMHASLINQTLASWGRTSEEIDLVASHGQTIFHMPKRQHKIPNQPNATLQVGDGDHIAAKTGIITVSDFRQKHIAHGGEGAPLALYGDYLLTGRTSQARVLLNIGGIANFSYFPTNASINEVVCTDVGPGNTLMDAFVQQHFNKAYDKNGDLAASGKVHDGLIRALMGDMFFEQTLPRTTGQDYFNLDWLTTKLSSNCIEKISKVDILCTLNHFAARCIADAIRSVTDALASTQILLSGGGYLNKYLIRNIEQYLKRPLDGTSAIIGLDPDAKEAMLFAILANQLVASDVNESQRQSSNSDYPWVSMGKISFPL